MSNYETLLLERDGDVATLTLHRPEKLNALNRTVLRELSHALSALDDGSVRAAVLTGAGGKAFVAGADIAEMAALSPVEAKAFAAEGHRVGHQLEALPFPVIAAVAGFALGGGCELALCCDFIYAADNAKFGQPEVNLGLMPGFGGTQRLSRRVGLGWARELVLSAVMIDAEEARRIGLVNRVFPRDRLLPEALAAAKKIAEKGPLAVSASKRAMLEGSNADLRVACELETLAFAGLFGSEDQREGTRAFLEKRAASFKGR